MKNNQNLPILIENFDFQVSNPTSKFKSLEDYFVYAKDSFWKNFITNQQSFQFNTILSFFLC